MMWTLKVASEKTGLPYSVLRRLCLERKIVHIKSGVKYYVNADALLAYLSKGEGGEGVYEEE